MTTTSETRPRRRFLKWVLAGVAVLCLLAIAVPLGALKYNEHQVMSKMTATQQAEFQQWYTKKTSITDDDIRLEPFSEAMEQAMDHFAQAWQSYKPAAMEFDKGWQETAYNPDATISDEFLSAKRDTLAGVGPFIDAFAGVVYQADYSIEVWETLAPDQAAERKYLNMIRSATRLIYARAMMNARAGNTDLAITDADTLVAYGTMSPYNSLLHKMIGMAGVEYGLEAYKEILAREPAARHKQQIFDKLWGRLPSIKFYPDASQDPMLLDHIGMTAPARRRGLEVSIKNKTGQEIMMEALRVKRNYLAQVALPASESEKIRERIQSDIDAMDESLAEYGSRGGITGSYRAVAEEVMAATTWMTAAPALKRASDNARETFEDYNTMLESLSRAVQ